MSLCVSHILTHRWNQFWESGITFVENLHVSQKTSGSRRRSVVARCHTIYSFYYWPPTSRVFVPSASLLTRVCERGSRAPHHPYPSPLSLVLSKVWDNEHISWKGSLTDNDLTRRHRSYWTTFLIFKRKIGSFGFEIQDFVSRYRISSASYLVIGFHFEGGRKKRDNL